MFTQFLETTQTLEFKRRLQGFVRKHGKLPWTNLEACYFQDARGFRIEGRGGSECRCVVHSGEVHEQVGVLPVPNLFFLEVEDWDVVL